MQLQRGELGEGSKVRGREGSGGPAGIRGRAGDGTGEVNALGHHATWLGSTPCPHEDVGPNQCSSQALRHAHPGKPAPWTSLKMWAMVSMSKTVQSSHTGATSVFPEMLFNLCLGFLQIICHPGRQGIHSTECIE